MSTMSTMKGRWTVLFWTGLIALIGLSWLTTGTGGSLWEMLNIALVGQIAATSVAFYAMKVAVPVKWPAAVALCCAGPMALQMIRLFGYVTLIIKTFGIPAVLLMGGSLGTIAVAVWILVKPLAAPIPEPPVAPARVVDTDD